MPTNPDANVLIVIANSVTLIRLCKIDVLNNKNMKSWKCTLLLLFILLGQQCKQLAFLLRLSFCTALTSSLWALSLSLSLFAKMHTKTKSKRVAFNSEGLRSTYASCFALRFSAFFLWMCSISTRLFLKTLPFTLIYSAWYLEWQFKSLFARWNGVWS